MRLFDIYPKKSLFKSIDDITFYVVYGIFYGIKNCKITIYYLNEVQYQKTIQVAFKQGKGDFFIPPLNKIGGFGIHIQIDNQFTYTAFEINDDWKTRPRYGFLSDFSDNNLSDIKYVDTFLKLHINVVQYYDWMYQHNDLISPTDSFIDLMGRRLNQKVVKNRIEKCQELGITNMAYGAIYGASNEFYNNHLDWAFFNNSGQAISFIDVFTIMNFTKESGWRKHLINEYKKAINIMGFDGIHMDTYGYPKIAFDYQKNEIRLDEHFNELIDETKRELQKDCSSSDLIFNNVGSWPIDVTYKADQSALYIEVWDPISTYNDLLSLVKHVKTLDHQKQLIISAYLKPYYESNSKEALNAFKLLSAVLFASGAFHLIMGEDKKVLRTGYYCDYGSLNEDEFEEVRRYYDFNAMYSDVLYDPSLVDVSITHTKGDNIEYLFNNVLYSPQAELGKVLTILKEKNNQKVIHMINFTDSDNMLWNNVQKNRSFVSDIEIQVLTLKTVDSVYVCSPDENIMTKNLDFSITQTNRGNIITFNIEKLEFWNMVVINEK